MPDLKVGRFMPVVVNQTTLPFYQQIAKLLVKTEANLPIFIVFDNFFKVAHVYVSLLWWNINAILKISIENFMEYPKHSKIQFYYRNPSAFILLKGFWKVARMKKKTMADMDLFM